jgi:hypothetical protein
MPFIGGNSPFFVMKTILLSLISAIAICFPAFSQTTGLFKTANGDTYYYGLVPKGKYLVRRGGFDSKKFKVNSCGLVSIEFESVPGISYTTYSDKQPGPGIPYLDPGFQAYVLGKNTAERLKQVPEYEYIRNVNGVDVALKKNTEAFLYVVTGGSIAVNGVVHNLADPAGRYIPGNSSKLECGKYFPGSPNWYAIQAGNGFVTYVQFAIQGFAPGQDVRVDQVAGDIKQKTYQRRASACGIIKLMPTKSLNYDVELIDGTSNTTIYQGNVLTIPNGDNDMVCIPKLGRAIPRDKLKLIRYLRRFGDKSKLLYISDYNEMAKIEEIYNKKALSRKLSDNAVEELRAYGQSVGITRPEINWLIRDLYDYVTAPGS